MAEPEKTAKQLREEAKQLLKEADQLASKELAEQKNNLFTKLKPHFDDFVKKVEELEVSDNIQTAYGKFQKFIDNLTTPTAPKDIKDEKKVKKRVKRTKEDWAAIVAEAKETSVAETAKKHGIATSQIYSWKKKLG